VTTRKLIPLLAEAIDSLTERDLRMLIEAVFSYDDGTEEQDGPVTRLLDAAIMQAVYDHRMRRERERALMARLEADHRAEVEATDLEVNGPPPPVEGAPMAHDPDTGAWTAL
jgi:hypothetical protein